MDGRVVPPKTYQCANLPVNGIDLYYLHIHTSSSFCFPVPQPPSIHKQGSAQSEKSKCICRSIISTQSLFSLEGAREQRLLEDRTDFGAKNWPWKTGSHYPFLRSHPKSPCRLVPIPDPLQCKQPGRDPFPSQGRQPWHPTAADLL